MKQIIFAVTIMVSGVFPQNLTLKSNEYILAGNVREIVERASRPSQKVFVEDFTGLN